MPLVKPFTLVILGALVAGCADQSVDLTGPVDAPLVVASSEGSVLIPIAEDGVFCFDGEWSPPIGGEDPLTWASGWGNVAILFPEGGGSPPPDVLRLKGEPAQTHVHYGVSGPIALGYEGAPHSGYGHARFTWFFNASRGGVRVMASINGAVQDAGGAWFHLTCKDINDDMSNEEYVVTMMNLSPVG